MMDSEHVMKYLVKPDGLTAIRYITNYIQYNQEDSNLISKEITEKYMKSKSKL
jgi:hypothetical protein